MASEPEATAVENTLEAASALAGLKAKENEVGQPKPEPSDIHEEGSVESSFVIPQRFTKSGRKRAVPFTIKVRVVCNRYRCLVEYTSSPKASAIPYFSYS